MPYIDGIGDEVVYAALIAAPVVFVYCSSAGVLGILKKGYHFVRKWIGNLGQDSSTSNSATNFANMDSPDGNDCCSICHDSFTLPCQANCSHWFCGDCILRVWHHSAALHPCKCPICRRGITLLIPGRAFSQNNPEINSERVLREISKYNRIFGGGPVSFIQRVRDMPLLLRRFFRELTDPQRAIFLLHRTRFVLLVFLSFCYVLSPIDILPEAVLGLIGLVDDIIVVMFALFYLSMIYRRVLVRQHGGH